MKKSFLMTIILNCEDIMNKIKIHRNQIYVIIGLYVVFLSNIISRIEFKIIIFILSIIHLLIKYWKKKIIFSFYLNEVNYIINIFLNLLI